MRKLIEAALAVLAAGALIVGLHHLVHTPPAGQGAAEQRKGD